MNVEWEGNLKNLFLLRVKLLTEQEFMKLQGRNIYREGSQKSSVRNKLRAQIHKVIIICSEK